MRELENVMDEIRRLDDLASSSESQEFVAGLHDRLELLEEEKMRLQEELTRERREEESAEWMHRTHYAGMP